MTSEMLHPQSQNITMQRKHGSDLLAFQSDVGVWASYHPGDETQTPQVESHPKATQPSAAIPSPEGSVELSDEEPREQQHCLLRKKRGSCIVAGQVSRVAGES